MLDAANLPRASSHERIRKIGFGGFRFASIGPDEGRVQHPRSGGTLALLMRFVEAARQFEIPSTPKN